jgi:hypothetical protein
MSPNTIDPGRQAASRTTARVEKVLEWAVMVQSHALALVSVGTTCHHRRCDEANTL